MNLIIIERESTTEHYQMYMIQVWIVASTRDHERDCALRVAIIYETSHAAPYIIALLLRGGSCLA